ncbi:MAG: immunoglobulin-like domain-containing protein [Terrimicrobiaceae bacterium]
MVITIYATSSPTAAGNDYAEMFPVSNPGITAGDIVAVDVGIPISMKLAVASDDAPLAGIIATDPGQLLGDKDAVGSRPVALSGRVPTKVNLEGGPISIGDRIAPSSVPGVGKKAGPFDHSVGIALDSFSGSADASSQGSVTVFIDLQQGIDVNAIALKLLGWDNPAVAAGFASATSSESSEESSPLDFVGGVMREIATRIDSLASTELTYSADATSTGMTSNDASSSPASSTPADTFASGLLRSIFAQIARWLANAANGIESIFAKVGNFGKVNTDELCVGGTCVSSLQFQAMVAAAGQSHAAANTSGSEEPPPMSSSPADATNTPPVIRINGNNPSHINIGDTYQDLGATAKDNEGHDLGVKTFLNDALVSDIVLDTSTTSTDTIDYVATDTWGNTATATRSVIIEPPAPPVTDSDPVPAVVPDAPALAPEATSASAPAASMAEIQPAPSASAIEPAAAPSDATPVIE